jgi:hypothetical protein
MVAGLAALSTAAAPPPDDRRAPAAPPGFDSFCTEHMCFRFSPELSGEAASLAEAAPRIVAAISNLLGGSLPPKTVVALTRTKKELASLMPASSRPPKWAAAVAFPRLAYIVMGPAGLSQSNTSRAILLAHEYSHVALRHATSFRRLPTWFVEGFADLQAKRAGPFSPDATQAPVPLSELERGFPAEGRRASRAYSQSRDFVVFLYNSGTPQDFRDLISLLERGVELESAVERIYGKDLSALESRWRRSFRFRRLLVPLITSGLLLWMLAVVLLVLGYLRQRKRRRKRMERQPDGRLPGDHPLEPGPDHLPGGEGKQPEETEPEEQPDAAPSTRFPVVWFLAGLGLTLILTALLRTILPDVRMATLAALTGIGVLLVLILVYRTR